MTTGAKNLLLLLLVAADVVLVTFVVDASGRSGPSAPTAGSSSTTGSTPTSSGTSTTGSSAAAGATLDPANVALAPLSVTSPTAAWLATPGTCASGGASLQTTTDAGRTWATQSVPFKVVTRVDASSTTAGFLVGGDQSTCAAASRATNDEGATWGALGSLTGTWFIDPLKRSSVHSTAGTTSTPCADGEARGLTRLSDDAAAVLCASGSVVTSTDRGRTWTPAPSHDKALALAAATSPAGVRLAVLASDPSCAGVAVFSGASTDAALRQTGCVPIPSPGQVTSIGFAMQPGSARTAWVVAGTTAYVSTDGLVTWKAAG